MNTIETVSKQIGMSEGDVRAVLLAIREPTPAMLRAASAAMSPGKRPTHKWVSNKQKHKIRYQAMIDAMGVEPEARNWLWRLWQRLVNAMVTP